MDSFGGSGFGSADLSKLSDRDKQELQQFAMNEGQKARIQSCTYPTRISHIPIPIAAVPAPRTSNLRLLKGFVEKREI